MLFIAVIPTFLEIAVPLSALLGVMLAFARLSSDSEIIIFRASGVSILSLTKVAIFFGSLVVVLSLWLSHYAKPLGFKTFNKVLFNVARSKSTIGLSRGVFNKLGSLILYAEDVNDLTGKLERVLVDDKRSKNERQVIVAERGRIVPIEKEERVIFFLEEGFVHQSSRGDTGKESYLVTKFDTNAISLTSDEIADDGAMLRGGRAKELFHQEIATSLNEIYLSIRKLNNGQEVLPLSPMLTLQMRGKELTESTFLRKSYDLRTERSLRWALPFSALIFSVLGIPLGINSPRTQRSWGAGLQVFIGLMVFITYYALLSVALAFTDKGGILPTILPWIPNLGSLIFLTFLLRGVASEKYASTGEVVERGILSLARIVLGQGFDPSSKTSKAITP
jgi:lipopolysaccharide export system permease protein